MPITAQHQIEPQLLTVEQSAVFLSVSPSTIRNMIRDGTLRYVFVRSAPRIKREDLHSFINSQGA